MRSVTCRHALDHWWVASTENTRSTSYNQLFDGLYSAFEQPHISSFTLTITIDVIGVTPLVPFKPHLIKCNWQIQKYHSPSLYFLGLYQAAPLYSKITSVWCLCSHHTTEGKKIWNVIIDFVIQMNIVLFYYSNSLITNQTHTFCWLKRNTHFPSITCYVEFLPFLVAITILYFLYWILFGGEALFLALDPSSVKTGKGNLVELKLHARAIFIIR